MFPKPGVWRKSLDQGSNEGDGLAREKDEMSRIYKENWRDGGVYSWGQQSHYQYLAGPTKAPINREEHAA